ncbi:MAG: diguanylate cyclase [Eubacterium sp.]|nr:diguanylate cyclase [Eubacterium sp.]MBR0412684.1 diguanylate cyclase [Eubacterium sp.]
MAVILVITKNLFYMINKSPDAGGIYTFEKRVGGNEFAVISQSEDYERIDELIKTVSEHNAAADASGGIVIACGMAKYDNEPCVAPVFERADQNMYDNKNTLKNG